MESDVEFQRAPARQHVATQTVSPSCCAAVLIQLQAVEAKLIRTQRCLWAALDRPVLVAADEQRPDSISDNSLPLNLREEDLKLFQPEVPALIGETYTPPIEYEVDSCKLDTEDGLGGSSCHIAGDGASDSSSLSDAEQELQPSSTVNVSPDVKPHEDTEAGEPSDIFVNEAEFDTAICTDLDSEEPLQPCVVQTWTCREDQAPVRSSANGEVQQTDNADSNSTFLWLAAESADSSSLPAWHQPVADPLSATELPSMDEEQLPKPLYAALLTKPDLDMKIYDTNTNEEVDFPSSHESESNKRVHDRRRDEDTKSDRATISKAISLTIKQEPEDSCAPCKVEFIDPSTELVESQDGSYMSDKSENSDSTVNIKNQETEGNISKTKRRNVLKCSCRQCSACCLSYSELERHTTVQHPGTQAHPCSKCNKSFSTQTKLRQHFRYIHIKAKPHVCKTCGTQFSDKLDLQMHQWKVHRIQSSAGIPLPRTWSRHCPCCHKVFSCASSTKRHFCSAHLNDKMYTCHICGEDFADKPKLIEHRLIHTIRDLRVVLVRCKERTPEKKQLNEQETDDSELCYCPHCGKRFSSSSDVLEHVRNLHPQQRVFQCETCGLLFAQMAALRTHELTNAGECLPAHQNRESEKQGENDSNTDRNKRNIQTHQQTHNDNQTFACLVCGKFFGELSNVLHHAAIAHRQGRNHDLSGEQSTHMTVTAEECSPVVPIVKTENVVEQDESAKSYTCSLCDTQFPTALKLQKHSYVHSVTRHYCCSVCGWRYQQACHLKNHMKTHRGLSWLKTANCVPACRQILNPFYDASRADTDVGIQISVHTKAEEDSPSPELSGSTKGVEALISEGGSLMEIKQEPEDSNPELIDPSTEFVLDHSNHSDFMVKKSKQNDGSRNSGHRSGEFRCWQCPARYQSSCQLQRHTAAQHPGTGAHACSKCNKSFTTIDCFKNHIHFAHLKAKPYVCNTCDSRFTSKRSLKIHRVRIHKIQDSESFPLPLFWSRNCPLCPKVFHNPANTQRHFFCKHLINRKDAYRTCGEEFTDWPKLQNHQQTHKQSNVPVELSQKEKNKPERELKDPGTESLDSNTCPHCERIFSTPGYAYRHVRHAHPKQRIFKCTTCSMLFAHPAALHKHKLTHVGQSLPTDGHLRSEKQRKQERRPFDKALGEKRNLRTSQQTHSENPAFSCLSCGKTFIEPSSLNRHTAMAHRQGRKHDLHKSAVTWVPKTEMTDQNQRLKSHACSQCDSHFTTAGRLQKHRVFHSKARGYECKVCSWRFKHENHLKTHMQTHRSLTQSEHTALSTASTSSQQPLPVSAVNLLVDTKPPEGTAAAQCLDTKLVESWSDEDACVDLDSDEEPQKLALHKEDKEGSKPDVPCLATESIGSVPFPVWQQPIPDLLSATELPSAAEQQVSNPLYDALLEDAEVDIKININPEVDFPTSPGLASNKNGGLFHSSEKDIGGGEAAIREGDALTVVKQEPVDSDATSDAEAFDPSEFVEADCDSDMSDEASHSDYMQNRKKKTKQQDSAKNKGNIRVQARCGQYPAHFQSYCELQKHPTAERPDTGAHTCSQCSKTFSNKGHLKQHFNFVHLKQKPYLCKICDIGFASKTLFLKHKWKKHRPDDLTGYKLPRTWSSRCPCCLKVFSCAAATERHFYNAHLNENMYLCLKCGDGFSERSQLRIHQLTHTARNSMLELPCNKGMPHQKYSKEHKTEKTEGSNLNHCPHCEKIFSSKGNAIRHIRIAHSKQKIFQCTTCRSTFALSSALQEHELMHTDQTSEKHSVFSCAVCGKACGAKDELKKHQETHHGSQKYHCLFCGKVFRILTNLNRHAAIAHRTRADKQCPVSVQTPSQQTESSGTVSCTKCRKQFCREHQVGEYSRIHSRVSAEEQTPRLAVMVKTKKAIDVEPAESHTCSKCNERLSSKSNLQKHLLVHSEARPHPCSICGWRFIMKCHLKLHMQRHRRPSQLLELATESPELDGIQQSQPAPPKNHLTDTKPPKGTEAAVSSISLVEPESDADVCVDLDSEDEPLKFTLHKINKSKSADKLSATAEVSAPEQQVSNLLHDGPLHVQEMHIKNFGKSNMNPEADFPISPGLASKDSEKDIGGGEAAIREGDALTVVKQEPVDSDVMSDGEAFDPSAEFVESDCDSYKSDEASYSDYKLENNNKSKQQDTDKTKGNPSAEFSCWQCPARFQSHTELDKHTVAQHSGTRAYPCYLCSKNFLNKSKLSEHLSIIHLKNKSYLCKECSIRFENKSSLMLHKWKKHKLDCSTGQNLPRTWSCQCPLCSKSFGSPMITKRHFYNVHLSGKMYLCSTCDDVFSDSSQLYIHQQAHTDRNFKKESPEDKAEPHQVQSAEHKLVNTEDTNLKRCPHCGQEYSSIYNVIRHSRIAHTDKSIFWCTTCPSLFALKSALHEHELKHADQSIATHRRSEPQSLFPCALCSEDCSSKQELKNHQQAHSGSQVYPCLLCGKVFRKLPNLNRHAAIAHRGGRVSKLPAKQSPDDVQTPGQQMESRGAVFSCRKCSKQFGTLRQLWGHGKKHCTVATPKQRSTLTENAFLVQSAGAYTCSKCHTQFSHRTKLEKHRFVHSKERPLQCTICGWRFNQKNHLTVHMQRHRRPSQPSEHATGTLASVSVQLSQSSSKRNLLSDTKAPEGTGEAQSFNVELLESESDVDVCVDLGSEDEALKLVLHESDKEDRKLDNLLLAAESADCSHLSPRHQPVADLLSATELPSAAKEQDSEMNVKLSRARNTNEEMGSLTLHESANNSAGEATRNIVSSLSEIKQEPEDSDPGNTAEFIDPSTEFVESDDGSYVSDHSSMSGIKKKKRKQEDSYTEKSQNSQSSAARHSWKSVECYCWQCSAHCQSYTELEQHTAAQHPGTRAHLCSQCNKSFTTMGSLTDHIRFVHQNEKSYVCGTCGIGFSKMYYLQNHEEKHKLSHSGGQTRILSWSRHCPRCSKVFRNAFKTKRHFLLAHQNDKLYACHTCGNRFANRSKLHYHQKQHARQIMTKEILKEKEHKSDEKQLKMQRANTLRGLNLCRCPHCSKRFITRVNALRHILNVHPKKRPLFALGSDIQKQDLTETGQIFPANRHFKELSPFSCALCGVDYRTKEDLKIHEDTHSASQKYPCLLCGKMFRKLINLKRHAAMAHRRVRGRKNPGKLSPESGQTASQQMESKGAVFSCRKCSKQFGTLRQLWGHGKKHCTVAALKQRSTVTAEVKRKRAIDVRSAGAYTCSQCNTQFPQRSKLEKHRFVHSEERPLQCTICGWRFNQKNHLTVHMQRHCTSP